jgi:hypothetical protein
MPKFFLRERNDLDLAADGMELPDLEAARTVASGRYIVDRSAAEATRRIDIEDEEGRVLDTVWFRDIVNIDA